MFIRAATRNPDSQAGQFLIKIGADEVVKFDIMDPSTFLQALEGINVVYDSSPDPLDGKFDLVDKHKEFVELMDPCVVRHVVRLSCIGTRLEHAFEFDSTKISSELLQNN